MDKLIKLYENYKKYYQSKSGDYTKGHLKFKSTISKEKRQQLIEKDEVQSFTFNNNGNEYLCSFSLYENAGYLHYKLICLENGKKINTKTFLSIVKHILIENGYLNKDEDNYNNKKK